MRVLEIRVGVPEQGTDTRVPERGKQCMQTGNMSLSEAWNTRGVGGKEKTGGKETGTQTPFPFLQP